MADLGLQLVALVIVLFALFSMLPDSYGGDG